MNGTETPFALPPNSIDPPNPIEDTKINQHIPQALAPGLSIFSPITPTDEEEGWKPYKGSIPFF